jgi:CBS domain-containing protein
MRVKDAMTIRAETIGPDATLQEAARMMRSLGIGILPVAEHDRVLGVITDRDVVVRSTAEGGDPRVVKVRAAMTPQVIHCYEDAELDDAAHEMEQHAVRRLVVLDARQRLVGLLSVDDLAMVSRALAAEVIEQSREPGRRPVPAEPPGGGLVPH